MALSKSGYFGWAGGGKNGAIVDLWATSRFSHPPAENSAPPDSNPPDAGPVTTGVNYGGPGAYTITDIPSVQDYYQRVQYGGNSYWGVVAGQDIAGQPNPDDPSGIVAFLSHEANSPYTITGSTLTAIDPTNLVLPAFVAPTSGKVRLEWNCLVDDQTPNGLVFGALFTNPGSAPTVVITENPGGTPLYGVGSYDAIVSGLTTGDSYQFELAASCHTGSAFVTNQFSAYVTVL